MSFLLSENLFNLSELTNLIVHEYDKIKSNISWCFSKQDCTLVRFKSIKNYLFYEIKKTKRLIDVFSLKKRNEILIKNLKCLEIFIGKEANTILNLFHECTHEKNVKVLKVGNDKHIYDKTCDNLSMMNIKNETKAEKTKKQILNIHFLNLNDHEINRIMICSLSYLEEINNTKLDNFLKIIKEIKTEFFKYIVNMLQMISNDDITY